MTGTGNTLRRPYLLIVTVVALLIAALGVTDTAGATHRTETQVDVQLTLLHNNDGESALLESIISGQPFGGVAPFATVVQELRKQGERGSDQVALLVSSGDNFLAGAQFQASLDKGVPYYDAIAMDIIGYDAIAIGNHEFDFGPDVFGNFVRSFESKTPFLSANLDFSDEPGLRALVRQGRIAASVSLVEEGRSFGIIGATTEFLPIISSPRDVIVNEVLPAVEAEIDKLQRRGINKIILISHLQSILEDLDLVAMLDDIDIVVAGGGDELLANDDDLLVPGDEGTVFGAYPIIATDVDGTEVPVVTTSGSYRYVGQLVVDFDSLGNVVEIDDGSGPVRVTTGAFDDAVVANPQVTQAVVEPVQAYVAALATTVVAQTEVPLNSARGTVATAGDPPTPVIPIVVTNPGERVSNTNLGNLAADSMMWQATELAAAFGVAPPDIAFQNGGGIRLPDILLFPEATPASPVNVTRLDINNQFPFPNFVSMVEGVPVTQLKVILENAVSRVEFIDGRFAHVSGMTYEWNSTGTSNVNRVKKITVGGTVVYDEALGGYQVPETTTFNVATIDFLARGGDAYDFGGLPFTTLGVTYEQAVLNYLAGPLGGLITEAAYPNAVNTRVIQTG
jgi:5'-nucleotidase/UDP-sugar diphosphatase